jgi:hypothetical protein
VVDYEEERERAYYQRIRSGDFRNDRERYEVETLLPWAEAEARRRVEAGHSSNRFPHFEDQLARMWTEDIFWEAKKRAEREEREERDRQRREEEERQEAEKAESARLRKLRGKPRNSVVFDVKATIAPDAEGTFEAIKKRCHPGKKLHITHAKVEGQNLWAWFGYDEVKGGHPADVRRALDKCLADAGATLVGDPSIEVIERTRLEE